MPIEFRYFRGPESDMGLLRGFHTCSLCGQDDRCFSLNDVISNELTEEERRGKVGCRNCLRRDRCGFTHDTVVGSIMEAGLIADDADNQPRRIFMVADDGEATAAHVPLLHPSAPRISDDAIAELRRTPSFSTWQELCWPVHHDDFMAFVGYSETGSKILFDCLHCGERTEIDDPD